MFLFSLLLGAVGFCVIAILRGRQKPTLPLPPGPRRKFITGNLSDLPSPGQQDWFHWAKHKELYGPISSLTVLGRHIIILNDAKLATQLLEKRSSIHSSRPDQTFPELSGWDKVLGAAKNPDYVRKTRKYLSREIGSNKNVSRFEDIQTTEVGRFLLRVFDEPEKLQQHIRKEAGAVVLKMAYGYTIEPHDSDPLVDLADKGMEDFSFALLPATWAVEFLPILRHLPAWFPGANFAKTAKAYKVRAAAFSDIPYAFVRDQMEKGTFVPSFLSNLLQEHPVKPGTEDETIIKWSAGSLYAGGADTTVSAIASFFLAMALFPEVQRRAQQELDTVVGTDRLPQFRDREDLIYINALIKEVLRWNPVVPVNLAHAPTQDDTCEGYLIPKGSSVIANIWAFTHDVLVYNDPMEFKPERFLDSPDGSPPERDPHMLVFGYGRRACPGRTLADANVFLTVAQSLAVFNIAKPIRNGQVEELSVDYLPGVISHPTPFTLSIKPRSMAHQELIQSLGELYPWGESDAQSLASHKT
ncbi:hypothetical protein N7508_007755 [Penicillium antarcticum]|uniref:uncharacterized protein n=1 Tax=Penicillium antarcticum TaxID=416450 RepID=UPI0023838B85|nr:uncharacterized protein N7508_007755 [Penicillium antarcticum]KAJ5297506.1 hypothetical protein N7508_007755 [Penicillium antarcticum]